MELDALLAAVDVLLLEAQRDRKQTALEALERMLIAALAQWWGRQGRAFLRRLAAYRLIVDTLTRADWQGDWDAVSSETRAALQTIIATPITDALLAGATAAREDIGTETLGTYGITFDATSPRAVAYLEDRQLKLGADVDATTADAIDRIITDAAKEGLSYDATARRIAEAFAQFATPAPQEHIRTRAELIATTELGNAFEHGNQQIGAELQAAGLEMQKAWLTAEDARVDDGCWSNEQAGWIPFDDTFPSGVDRPLDHPGCRCTLLQRQKPEE